MLKFYVRKSSVEAGDSSYDKEKLAKLKAKVIAILKDKDSEDLKKAIEYFTRDEARYSHLDKSLNGQWIEKAGYGVGTVRIWKGKKYKKVSTNPTRWIRVFDKVDRGAKSSMTRLIHKVQMCTTAEELYNFCLSNHALFQDENGVDLPIMDSLRVAVDEHKGKIERGEVNKPAEKKESEPMDPEKVKKIHDKIEENKKKGKTVSPYEAQKQLDDEELMNKVKTINDNAKKKSDATSLGKTESGKEIKTQTNTKKHIAIAKGDVSEDKFGFKVLTISKSPALKAAFKQMDAMFKEGLKTYKKGENSRPFMAGYGVVDGYLCATDGKVAMRLKIDGLEELGDRKCVKVVEENGNYIITHDDTTYKYKTTVIDGRESKTVEKDTPRRDRYDYPNVSRVIPESNSASMKLDNEAVVNKIKELKDIGYFDEVDWSNRIEKDKKPHIEFNIKSGGVYLDDVKVGDVNNYSGDDFTTTFDYHLLLQSIAGNANEMAFDPDSIEEGKLYKAVTFSTNVSDVVVMPMRTDRELQNSKDFKESDEYKRQQKAKDLKEAKDNAKQQEKEASEARSMKDEAKSELLKNKPAGVTDNIYENLINYTDKFYADLGYDNTSERAKQQIKQTVDTAINNVNNKNFDILEMIENTDNKVSRKVFEAITAIPLGTNKESARKAWKKWVGHDAMKKHNDDINAKVQAEKNRQAAEKKAREDAENEQYNGFLGNKTPAGRAKAMEILNKKGGFKVPNKNGDLYNKVMTWQELVDLFIGEGGKANIYEALTVSGKKKPYYSVSGKDGRGYEVPKTVYDYAMHISGKNVEKSFANIIMLDEYEHEDFEDFEDFDATQPELFNTASKVSAAINAVRCC